MITLYADTETVSITTENVYKLQPSMYDAHIQKRLSQSKEFVTTQFDKAKETGQPQVLQVVNVLNQGIFDDGTEIIDYTIPKFFTKAVKYVRRKSQKSCLVYYHNLKFDAMNIIDHFKSENINVTFKDYLIVNTTWYTFQFFYKGVLFRCVDSYKLCMISLKEFGKAFGLDKELWKKDYTFDNSLVQVNALLTHTDKEVEVYGMNDVKCLKAGLEKFREFAHSDKMTIASCAFDDWKKKQTVELPKLDTDEQTFANLTYTGGICTYNKSYQGKVLEGDFTYIDNNGLYSAAGYSKIGKFTHPYPISVGCHEFNKVPDFKNRNKFYTIKARIHAKVKEDTTIAFFRLGKQWNLGISLSRPYKQNEYVEYFHEVCYINSIDLRLLYQYYDILDIEFLEYYEYQTKTGIFDSYSDEWIAKKTQGTVTKNAPLKTVAKYMNNSLTGKFGQFILPIQTQMQLNEKSVLSYQRIREDKEPTFVYMPIVSAILSYAREIFLDMTNSYPKEFFIYGDTDSNIMFSEAYEKWVDKSKISPTELGLWDIEHKLNKVKVLRQKTYMMTEKDTGEITVKCAGATKEAKKYITYDNFEVGGEIVDENKKPVTQLKPSVVPGGIALIPQPFAIKESSFFH